MFAARHAHNAGGRRAFRASSRADDPAVANPATSENVPWLAEVQEPPGVLPADAPELSPLLVDAAGQKIKTLDAWRRGAEEIRRWWLDFLGPLPSDRRAPPPLTVVAEDRPDGVIRQLVTYEIEPNGSTEAYLLRPAEPPAAGDAPAAGRGRLPSDDRQFDPRASRLRGLSGAVVRPGAGRRGCVTFCPRNYLWPTTAKIMPDAEAKRYSERHPGSKGMAKMLSDGIVALDILAAQADVDANRWARSVTRWEAKRRSISRRSTIACGRRSAAKEASAPGFRIGTLSGFWEKKSGSRRSPTSTTSCWHWSRRGRFCWSAAIRPMAPAAGRSLPPRCRSTSYTPTPACPSAGRGSACSIIIEATRSNPPPPSG